LKKLTILQKKIIRLLQADLPLTNSPYAKIARTNGVTEDAIVKEITHLKKAGYLRRFGAILNHHGVGLKVNCMCVWKVPTAKIEKIGKVSSRQPQISHCYQRKALKDWPYNFYTMIHAGSKKECSQVIENIITKSGVNDYRMLFTKKQFKKTSPKYMV